MVPERLLGDLDSLMVMVGKTFLARLQALLRDFIHVPSIPGKAATIIERRSYLWRRCGLSHHLVGSTGLSYGPGLMQDPARVETRPRP